METQKLWDKKILTVLMQWDYGDKSRGSSNDKAWFHDNFALLASQVEPFWYDEYLNDLPGLRQALIKKAENFNPDLIFFLPYTDQLDARTLDSLRSRWKTCAWFGDDTWRFESYSSKLAPHFTHVCTTDIFSAGKYRALGIDPIITQWAGQPGRTPLGNVPPEKYEYDVSFVGAYNEVRGWFMDRLQKNGVMPVCFGPGWPKGKISDSDMMEVFRKSRVNLNISNSVPSDIRYIFGGARNLARYLVSKKTAEQIKARNFEIPLSGGFQLTNYVAGLETYFRIGEEVSVYSSPEECADRIKYHLANEAERLRITLAGHERSRKEHTYVHRLKKVLERIWP